MPAKKQQLEDSYLNNPNLPTQNSKFEFTPQMAKDYKKCMKNIDYFAQNYFYITTLDEGKKVIDLYPAQKRVLKGTARSRFMILLASRQSGKTTIMTIFALWNTCFNEDKRVLIVANKEDTAIIILRRIRTAYEQLPNWLKPGVKQWGKTEVIFSNDSSISISTTSGSSSRGDTINILIIDEAAHIPEHIIEEFWKSVIPVISSSRSTKIFCVSTPNGTGNKFYEIYSGAERGDLTDWTHERIDWWEVPGRGKKWEREMRQTLSREEFGQEFENKFLEKGESSMSGDAIGYFRSTCKDPSIILDDGHYKVWEEPIEGHIYDFGVDVGEGVGEAASVCQVLDITNLQDIKQVACYHHELLDPYHFAGVLYRMANQWGRPWMLIERNNCGGQVVDCLTKTHNYEKLVSYTPDKVVSRMGVYNHTNTKYKGVTNMRYYMNSLQCVEVRDIALVQEFETFVRHNNNTWKKRPGKNTRDDRVMAMCWGIFMLNEDVTPLHYDVSEWDENGKPHAIQNITVEPPEFYRLDEYYLKDNSPLPVHFGTGMEGTEDDYLQQGWTFF